MNFIITERGVTMRYTRLEIPKSTNFGSYKLIIEFFIIIPIIATLIGGILTRFLIIPYFTNNISSGSQSNNDTQKPIILGKEYSSHMLQAGAYANKGSAEGLVKAMVDKGHNAFYLEEDETYKIIIDVFEDKEAAQKKQAELKSSGYNCIIHDYTLYVKGSSGKNNKAIENYRYELASLIKQEFQAKAALGDKKEYNMEIINTTAAEVEQAFGKIKDSGIPVEKIEELAKYNKVIIQLSQELAASKDVREITQKIGSQILNLNKISNYLDEFSANNLKN